MKTKKKVVDRESTQFREEMAAYVLSIVGPAPPMTPEEKEEYEREFARRVATMDQAVEVEEILAEFKRLSSSKSES